MQSFQRIGRKHGSRVLKILALQEFVCRIRLRVVMRHGFEIAVLVFEGAANLVDGVLRSIAFESRECFYQCETRHQKYDGQEGSQGHRRKQNDLFANRHSSGATRHKLR